MVDNIINGKTRKRYEYCSYYTDADPILDYMVDKLKLVKKDVILEPCAGDGLFIEKILSQDFSSEFIEAVDLNPKAVKELKRKFQDKGIKIREVDTLFDLTFDLYANSGGYFTKIIGNPPYGAWQDEKKKANLKKKYGGYVKETYTLFLERCISLLRENGRLVFIVPDTFLALNLHKKIRKILLFSTTIEEILLIPSKFFPGVSFGYSNLCIITLVKRPNTEEDRIKIVSVSTKVEDINLLKTASNQGDSNYSVLQNDIKTTDSLSFYIGGDEKVRSFITNYHTKVGDIANCVTGFYSGDNKLHLKPISNTVKGAKDLIPVDKDLISFNQEIDINGINGKNSYIPILKGGGSHLVKENEWFINWNKASVDYYRKDKKARFQNSKYYFKKGIGIPMVKGSRLFAFELKDRLFDQSIVGIFPENDEHYLYLLTFLNSEICTQLLKVINHTANNSANYIKKIPFIYSESLDKTIKDLYEKLTNGKFQIPEYIMHTSNLFDRLYEDSIKNFD